MMTTKNNRFTVQIKNPFSDPSDFSNKDGVITLRTWKYVIDLHGSEAKAAIEQEGGSIKPASEDEYLITFPTGTVVEAYEPLPNPMNLIASDALIILPSGTILGYEATQSDASLWVARGSMLTEIKQKRSIYDIILTEEELWENNYPRNENGYCTRNFLTWLLEKVTHQVQCYKAHRTMTIHDICIVERKGQPIMARGWIHFADKYHFVWGERPHENGSPNFKGWICGEEITPEEVKKLQVK